MARTETPATDSLSRDGINTVALVVFCQVVHGLTFAAIPLLLPLIREDLQISFTQAGMLSAAATLSYALGQIPAGYLSDRFGPRRLFFIGLLGWSALSLCFGLIHAFWLALLTQFIAGTFRALMFAPGLALLASWFPPERRATAMSLYMLGGFAGTIVLSLGGPLLAALYGWRTAFILLAAVGIGTAFLYKSFAREKPRVQPLQHLALTDIFQLFRYPIMWVCSGLQFVRFSVVTAFNFWLPSLLVADRGLSVQAAGLVFAMSAAFTAPSNTLGGYVSDRLKNPPLVIGGSLAILACTSTLLVVVESIPLLLLVVAVNSVFLQFYFGPLFLVPVEVLGQRVTGTAIGFSNLFANIGGFTTAYALGVIKDRAGTFSWGFAGISGVCLAGVVLAVVLARMRKRALAAHA
ncbi:MAG: MFS transporter [Betaproteobacteria bacterium]|nr:MFS transporter [Betaproteobacteria bacterium]